MEARPPPASFLDRYPPDRDALFDLIRPLTTDAMLHAIAACDYGIGIDLHLKELMRIRAGIDLSAPIGSVPGEVLQLFRWVSFQNERELKNRMAFHMARAFCAASLLLVPDEYENRTLFDNESLAPLVASSLVLGKPFRLRLLSYLAWSLQAMDAFEDENYLFHAFGAIAAMAHGDEDEKAHLPELGRWFLEVDADVLKGYDLCPPGAKTFLDVAYVTTNPERWRALASTLEERATLETPLREYVRFLQKKDAWKG